MIGVSSVRAVMPLKTRRVESWSLWHGVKDRSWVASSLTVFKNYEVTYPANKQTKEEVARVGLNKSLEHSLQHVGVHYPAQR
ncbi:hypothetical protein TNCV_2484951 [Trichonephila clavipes]|uniref:Uncharacterized protein n=1 Tax=Trichonephila clavipes TaxID=2585209 RepID=A0A8X6VZL4_TRICX|nr:hypothetical protein TNCV_2484951 [Trichonephila clavipes]